MMVVSDHKILRDGLKLAFEFAEDLEVVAEAGNGSAAVRLAQQHQPDIVVMDLTMPEMNGIDACKEIMRLLPNTKAVVLTASSGAEAAKEALLAGAQAYLPKLARAVHVVRTIRDVANGEFAMPERIIRDAVEGWKRGTEGERTREVELLTQREREIAVLVAKGLTNREIADTRVNAVFTIRNAVVTILDKLGLDNRAQLVRWAVEGDLLKGEE